MGLSALCLGSAGCAAAPEGAGGDEGLSTSEVLAAIGALDEASRRKDTAAVGNMLTDDYTYLSSRGGVRSRQWLLEELLGHPAYRLDHSERTELQVAVHGAAAVVSSRWRGEGSYDGQPIRDDQRCSLVLVKDGLGVKIALEHCTQITE